MLCINQKIVFGVILLALIDTLPQMVIGINAQLVMDKAVYLLLSLPVNAHTAEAQELTLMTIRLLLSV